MLQILHILVVFVLFPFSAAEEYLFCSGQNEQQQMSFSELSEPFLGFTETMVVYGVTYAGWYIVEGDMATLLPFKAWFWKEVYVDGIEIGERFETPRSQWASSGFIDYETMEEAFLDLSEHAPVCIIKQE
jgi:hypothetical protein